MTARRRSHWPLISAAAVTVATVIGGAVALLGYIQQVQDQQTRERSEWVAKNAVLEYRMDEAERDIADMKQQHQHDIDQIRQECSP